MTRVALLLALGRFKPIISEGRKMISLPAGGFCKTCICKLPGCGEESWVCLQAVRSMQKLVAFHFHYSSPFVFPERKLSGHALQVQRRLRRPEHWGCRESLPSGHLLRCSELPGIYRVRFVGRRSSYSAFFNSVGCLNIKYRFLN